MPPSTRGAAPFVAEEAGLAGNEIMAATSSGSMNRPSSDEGHALRRSEVGDHARDFTVGFRLHASDGPRHALLRAPVNHDGGALPRKRRRCGEPNPDRRTGNHRARSATAFATPHAPSGFATLPSERAAR